MAPPNVTVVQGGLGPFASPPPPHPPPTSSMLSYLYQSGLYSAAAAAAAHHHHQRPFVAPPRPPPDAAPFLPAAAPADAGAFPPFAAAPELGLVAAAAAGLHSLSPAALMLSVAAAHPWLYPGYLAAAAAALGQSLQPPATESAAASPVSPSARHRHPLVSSSSRFVPYAGRRPGSGRSTPGAARPHAAATPPPAPDTTDSPAAAEVRASPSPAGDEPDADREHGQLKNMEQMVNGLDHVVKQPRVVTSSGGATSSDVDVDVSVDSSKI